MTESPLKNILDIYLSLFTGCAFFPLLPLGTSVHISRAFSKTIFICLSKALTLAKIFLLFLNDIRTCAFALTVLVNKEKGPASNVSS